MRSAIEILDAAAESVIGRLDGTTLVGKRVLVVGASGLIGINMMAVLARAGCGLICGTYHSKREPWMSELYGVWIKTDWGTLPHLIATTSWDYIIHAVGYGQESKFLANARTTFFLNTVLVDVLTQHLTPTGRFLYLSSRAIYSGAKIECDWDENTCGQTLPDNRRAAYIESKRSGEMICNKFEFAYGTSVIARLGFVIGAGYRKNDERQVMQMVAGEDHGMDNIRRPWIDVRDAVTMLLNIMQRGREKVYNIGSRKTFSYFDVENVLLNCYDPETGVADVEGSLTRYDREFGVDATTSFNNCILSMREWYAAIS